MSTPKNDGARRNARNVPPLTPADSLAMLRSAIGYVMQSGLVARAANRDGKLVIVIHGAQLTRDTTQFVPVIELTDDVPVTG